MRLGVELGRDITLEALRQEFDAVFPGLGLQGINLLGAEGEETEGVENAVDFIADLRQAGDLSALPVGRDVVVIGGGMTAVDAAVQARLLGAENVTIVYRRGQEKMSVSLHEQDHATSKGVRIIHNAAPVRVIGAARVEAVEVACTSEAGGGLKLLDGAFTLKADQVLRAIGQRLVGLHSRGRQDRHRACAGPGRGRLRGGGRGSDRHSRRRRA